MNSREFTLPAAKAPRIGHSHTAGLLASESPWQRALAAPRILPKLKEDLASLEHGSIGTLLEMVFLWRNIKFIQRTFVELWWGISGADTDNEGEC